MAQVRHVAKFDMPYEQYVREGWHNDSRHVVFTTGSRGMTIVRIARPPQVEHMLKMCRLCGRHFSVICGDMQWFNLSTLHVLDGYRDKVDQGKLLCKACHDVSLEACRRMVRQQSIANTAHAPHKPSRDDNGSEYAFRQSCRLLSAKRQVDELVRICGSQCVELLLDQLHD